MTSSCSTWTQNELSRLDESRFVSSDSLAARYIIPFTRVLLIYRVLSSVAGRTNVTFPCEYVSAVHIFLAWLMTRRECVQIFLHWSRIDCVDVGFSMLIKCLSPICQRQPFSGLHKGGFKDERGNEGNKGQAIGWDLSRLLQFLVGQVIASYDIQPFRIIATALTRMTSFGALH